MGVQYFGDEKKNTYEPINQKGISRATVQEFFSRLRGQIYFLNGPYPFQAYFMGRE